jgi:hypothetical protein
MTHSRRGICFYVEEDERWYRGFIGSRHSSQSGAQEAAEAFDSEASIILLAPSGSFLRAGTSSCNPHHEEAPSFTFLVANRTTGAWSVYCRKLEGKTKCSMLLPAFTSSLSLGKG